MLLGTGARVWAKPALLALAASLALATSAAAQQYPGVADPGGDESAIVPVPPADGRFFGYHEKVVELSTHGWTPEQIAEVAAGGGANTARFTLDWWNVEPARDVADENWWAYYDRVHDAFVARGVRPLITLASTPPWAREPAYQACGKRRGCEYPPATWMEGEWAEFAAEVARRLPRTAAIEIWNEPNLENFWKPVPDPARFARLVAAAYPAIKAANPGIRVLAGGFAPTQTREYDLLGRLTRTPMREFLAAAYAANPSIKGKLDGISFHTVFQELSYGSGTLFAKSFDDVRSVSRHFGDVGVPLWVTETGLTTNGSIAVTEAEQRSGLMRQYRRMMTMPDVEGVVVHTLADRVELPRSDFNFGYGLIRSFSPFTPKLAYCAFAGRVDAETPYGGCPRIDEESGGSGSSDGSGGSGEGGSGGTGGSGGSGDSGGDADAGEGSGGEDADGAPGRKSRCSERLVAVRAKLARASAGERPELRRRHRALERRCVPCVRKVIRARKRVRRADPGELAAARADLRRWRRACAPCVRKLRRLERAAAAATDGERAALVRRHERVRRRCP